MMAKDEYDFEIVEVRNVSGKCKCVIFHDRVGCTVGSIPVPAHYSDKQIFDEVKKYCKKRRAKVK
jgi:hypothetical protein